MSGVPELVILTLLSRREMYGYELIAAIGQATGERIRLGEGVVYPTLHALERGGALRSRQERVNGRPRVYYRISTKGRRRLERLAGDWTRTAAAVAGVLGLEGPTGALELR